METEYEFKEGIMMEEENIDASLRQVFQQIKLQMQAVLREAFE